jgi:hypothetical protein
MAVSGEGKMFLFAVFYLYGQMFTDYAPRYAASPTWFNYFKFVTDAEALIRNCIKFKGLDLKYRRDEDYTQMVRIVAANLQYLGLQYVARAINLYAKELNMNTHEYRFMVDKLMKSYISKKMTVMTNEELARLFYDEVTDYQLPNSSNFELLNSDNRLALFYSTEIFIALASWNNDLNTFRLLVPFLKSPQVMTLLVKHLQGDYGIMSLPRIFCLGRSCVAKDRDFFTKNVYRTADRWEFKKELEVLYCKEFKDLSYRKEAFGDDANKLIDMQNSDDDYFKVLQLVALITGMPDLAIRANGKEELKTLLQSSIDRDWDYSTKTYLENLKPKLLWEEYVTAELVPSSFYFKDKYKIVFDINMGEFDRINQYAGKIKAGITLHLPNSFLKWAYRFRKDKYTVERLAREIEHYLKEKKEFFKDAPWNKNITPIIARELLLQMEKLPLPADGKKSKIEIEFRYAPFALNYIQKYTLDAYSVDSPLGQEL